MICKFQAAKFSLSVSGLKFVQTGKMNEDAEQLATASLIQYLQHEVKKRQKEDADELKQMFKKLSSWMDDSLGQLLDSINDNTQSIDKRLNVLTEEVGTLENKLSYITKERDDLLNIYSNNGRCSCCRQPVMVVLLSSKLCRQGAHQHQRAPHDLALKFLGDQWCHLLSA